MSAVTVYSTEKMEELLDAGVVSAAITAGHLVLTLRGGSTVDVGAVLASLPDATTTVKGGVELATDTETTTGTDSDRAVTPFGLAALTASATRRGLVELATNAEVLTGTDTSRAITPAGLRSVQVVTALAENALPTAYPVGNSLMPLSSSAWSINSGTGLVLTSVIDIDRASQTFYALSGGTQTTKTWTREYHSSNGGGGWTAWSQVLLRVNLAAGSFTQTTAFTSYPAGDSRIYYTTSNSSAWDFSGSAGEVVTYVDGSDFANQTYTKHVGGSTAIPEVWIRTANAASGWTPWRRIVTAAQDSGNPKAMAWGSVSITPVVNTPTSVTVTFPTGRFTSTPSCFQVSANTASPGSSVAEVSVAGGTKDSVDIILYRNNTVVTTVFWLAIQ